jgi:hypothetical protein
MGRLEENTTGVRFTLHDRPGVSASDRGKMGPRGESIAHPIESLPFGCASVVQVHMGGARWLSITLARTMGKRECLNGLIQTVGKHS